MKKIRVYTKSSRLHGCRLHAAVLFAALCLLPSLRGSAQVYAPDKNASKTTEEYLPDGTYVRTESSEQTSAEFITSASKSRRQKKVSQMAFGKKGENWALAQSYGKLPNPGSGEDLQALEEGCLHRPSGYRPHSARWLLALAE